MPNSDAADFRDRAHAEAATIANDVQAIRTIGYYAAGDGGGDLYYRSNTLGAGGLVSGDGASWSRAADVAVDLRKFGVKFDDVTNNTTKLQYALDNERNLLVPPGTARSDCLVCNYAGTRLVGSGGHRSILKFVPRMDSWPLISVTDRDNLVFDDIGFDLSNNLGAAIIAKHCIGGAIRRVHVKSGAQSAIALVQRDDLASCQDWIITDCLIENMGNHGLYLSRCSDIIVSNNRLRGIAWGAIMLGTCNNVVVSANRISGTYATADYAGIRLFSDCACCSVTGNFIRETNIGIFIIGANDCSIVGNVIRDTRAQGILLQANVPINPYCNDNPVVVNTISRPWINPAAYALSGGYGPGIELSVGAGATVLRNVIADNTIIDNRSPAIMTVGIYDNGTVGQNKFTDNVCNITLMGP